MDYKTYKHYTRKKEWTISELKNYLQDLVNDGHGDNKIRFAVKDHYSRYSEEMTFSIWSNLHNNSTYAKRSNLEFHLIEKNVSNTFDEVEMAQPKITYRKVHDKRNTSYINFINKQ
jgi:hypothetical protein